MNLMELVEELEDLVETSSQIPLTGKVMFDREEFLEVIHEMRLQIPREVQEAKQISSSKDSILESAQSEANSIIAGAKAHAEEIIREDELVLQANARAEEILERANEESRAIREGARDYADELLENTQVNLSEIIKMLNDNRQQLRG
ncbi:ATPase [Peptoniphilus equinus]|uniref:ATPase n=1 Tax=Peptoniphilus equinus TaxID=3016343 RepID=A0ABY7QS21_9FIRM|nr:ATPase [Peptoniphilus equinus]WBW49577.1 ATPase [Peptoniphilus equinus]